MLNNYNNSHFSFEEWVNPSTDPRVVDQEMQIQRRKRCPTDLSYIAYEPTHVSDTKQTVDLSVQVES